MKKLLVLLLIAFHTIIYSQTETVKSKGKVLIDISGGLAARIGTAEKTGNFIIDNKIKASRDGYFIDASLYVQIKPEMNHYLGVKYNSYFDYGNNNKLAFNFYAISYLYSKQLASKDMINVSISAGYISYKDDEYFSKDLVIKGGTIGLGFDGSYLVKISNGIYSGPKIGLQFGKISDFDVSSKNNPNQNVSLKDQAESVSTFNIGLVLRIRI